MGPGSEDRLQEPTGPPLLPLGDPELHPVPRGGAMDEDDAAVREGPDACAAGGDAADLHLHGPGPGGEAGRWLDPSGPPERNRGSGPPAAATPGPAAGAPTRAPSGATPSAFPTTGPATGPATPPAAGPAPRPPGRPPASPHPFPQGEPARRQAGTSVPPCTPTRGAARSRRCASSRRAAATAAALSSSRGTGTEATSG